MTTLVTKIINKLYQPIDGMEISLAERDRLQIDDSTFTYGEIDPETFAEMLQTAQPKSGEVFYDLGSGAGKAVFCAALLNNWRKCCGIEVLPGLYEVSKDLITDFQILPEIKKHFPEKVFFIDFILADILKADFLDADVIYLHATTFGYSLWEKLATKLIQLKSGARLIINTKQLDSLHFEKISEKSQHMGWGDSIVFTYRKL